MVNKYLKEKPLNLPDSLAPFAASPQLHLWGTGNGTGYAELLSYCTCDDDSATVFAKCDDRSRICSSKHFRTKQLGGNTFTFYLEFEMKYFAVLNVFLRTLLI